MKNIQMLNCKFEEKTFWDQKNLDEPCNSEWWQHRKRNLLTLLSTGFFLIKHYLQVPGSRWYSLFISAFPAVLKLSISSKPRAPVLTSCTFRSIWLSASLPQLLQLLPTSLSLNSPLSSDSQFLWLLQQPSYSETAGLPASFLSCSTKTVKLCGPNASWNRHPISFLILSILQK